VIRFTRLAFDKVTAAFASAPDDPAEASGPGSRFPSNLEARTWFQACLWFSGRGCLPVCLKSGVCSGEAGLSRPCWWVELWPFEGELWPLSGSLFGTNLRIAITFAGANPHPYNLVGSGLFSARWPCWVVPLNFRLRPGLSTPRISPGGRDRHWCCSAACSPATAWRLSMPARPTWPWLIGSHHASSNAPGPSHQSVHAHCRDCSLGHFDCPQPCASLDGVAIPACLKRCCPPSWLLALLVFADSPFWPPGRGAPPALASALKPQRRTGRRRHHGPGPGA